MTKQGFSGHLESQHTRVLLQYLNGCRKFNGWYSPWDNDKGFSAEMVKAELAKREHIPNKQEARKIRQEEAKGK